MRVQIASIGSAARRGVAACTVAALLLCVVASCSNHGGPSGTSTSDTSTSNLGLAPIPDAQSADASGAGGYDPAAVSKEIAAEGLTIIVGPSAAQTAGPFHAVSGMCTGSSDGHCGAVVFLERNAIVGSVGTADPGSVRFVSQNGTDVVVDLPHYLPSDPMCCPSGGAYTADYRWNGSRVVAVGPGATGVPSVSPTATNGSIN